MLSFLYFIHKKTYTICVLICVTAGFVGWEFCDYEPDTCVFKEYCTCKVMFAEMEEEERQAEIQVQQLLKILEEALTNMIARGSFSSIYRQSLDDPTPVGDLQTIATWLNIPIEDFPPEYKFNDQQKEAICDALLAFWEEEDEIHIWMTAVNPSTRYRALVEFFQTKVWCTNKGMIILPPLKPEDLKNIKSPLDDLSLRDSLDFSEEDFEDDLPF